MKIAIKRVYEPYEESDGYRVLVDRLWPRGLTRPVHYDEWRSSLRLDGIAEGFRARPGPLGHLPRKVRGGAEREPRGAKVREEAG